ncbi:MAG: hypothetical protein MI892_15440 [Desulfobacterales bacterium]|nr:hypothetical protein [Desulfobacterales bacterium]
MKANWKIAVGIASCVIVLIACFVLLQRQKDPVSVKPVEIKPIHITINTQVQKWRDIDTLLDKLEFGTIAFNIPNNLDINESSQIQLILSLSESLKSLQQQITVKGEKTGAQIKVSDTMAARLSGSMFQVIAITPEIQAVSRNHTTEWRWEIRPKKEGTHELHLTIYAILHVDGRSTPRSIKTFNKTIEVTITAEQKIIGFLKSNWQWLWAAIFVPLAGWLWKRKKSA